MRADPGKSSPTRLAPPGLAAMVVLEIVLGSMAATAGVGVAAAGAAAAVRTLKRVEPPVRSGAKIATTQQLLDSYTARVKRRGGAPPQLGAAGPRSPPARRRQTWIQIPIFSYGDFCGLFVALPEGAAAVCGPEGLLVTKVLQRQWAESCGAFTGTRLVMLDGKKLAGCTSAQIERLTRDAARPLWLELARGRKICADEASAQPQPAGKHLLL